MFRPLAALAVLACGGVLAWPTGATAQDPAAETPDVAVSEAQATTAGPSYGIAKASSTLEVWATVNICDSERARDSMGVRASMSGNGAGQRMYMRFTAEYWSRSRQAWTPVGGSGVSPWVYAGSADNARRQAGWTFEFAAPPEGVAFTMRAQVDFEWRAQRGHAAKRGAKHSRRARASRRRVVRSVSRMTATGIAGVHGGDPAGTSKAMCLIY